MGGWGRCSDEVQGVSLHRRQALRRVLSASQLCSRHEGDCLAQLRAGLQLSSTGRPSPATGLRDSFALVLTDGPLLCRLARPLLYRPSEHPFSHQPVTNAVCLPLLPKGRLFTVPLLQRVSPHPTRPLAVSLNRATIRGTLLLGTGR